MTPRNLVPVLALSFLLLVLAGAAPAAAATGEIRVDALPQARHAGPKVAVFPDGGFVVVWTVGPASGAGGRTVIHARFYKKNGSPATGEFRLVDRGVGSQWVDQVAADPDGSFLVAWTERLGGSFGNLFVQRFNRDGTPRGARIQLNAPGVFGRNAVLTIGPGRRFAAAWESDIEVPDPSLGYTDAVARVFSPQGAPLSDEILIGQGDGGIGDDNIYVAPGGLALGRDGSLTVIYEDYETGIATAYMARVPARSSTVSGITPVFQSYTSGFGTALARRPDGSLIAAWSEFEILARLYGPAGSPRGPAFPAFQTVVGRQWLPAVAALSNGGFVIVWNESDRDGSGSSVWGRVFAADGRPVSRDLRINTIPGGDQHGVAIATSPGGPVVAVWEGGGGIFARILAVTNP